MLNLKRYKSLLIFLTVLVAVLFVQFYIMPQYQKDKDSLADRFTFKVPYDLWSPDDRYNLKKRLNEISGLCDWDNNQLLTLQDESGKVYILNEKGELQDQLKFAKAGDFEGIARVGNAVYTLRSDGLIYEMKEFPAKDMEVVKHNTVLTSSNDTEGLCYDRKRHRLLVACKAKPGGDLSAKKKRAIYAFDLDTKTLIEEPVYTVKIKQVREATKDKKASFHPSGIAIHPMTGNIYILSASGNLMTVLNPEGEMIFLEYLSPKIHAQPEGIAFAANGDLLIANEAHFKGGTARLLRFKYQAQL